MNEECAKRWMKYALKDHNRDLVTVFDDSVVGIFFIQSSLAFVEVSVWNCCTFHTFRDVEIYCCGQIEIW